MLLHFSRSAHRLTKKAGLPGKILAGGLRTMGKAIRRHPVAATAIAGGTAAGAVYGKELINKARFGMSPGYLQYRRQTGYLAPSVPKQTPRY